MYRRKRQEKGKPLPAERPPRIRFQSGFFAPQPAQNLPPFPVWPQFGQVHSPSFWGLGDPHSGQKLPVFPSVPHFGQVQGAGTGAAFGGWGVI